MEALDSDIQFEVAEYVLETDEGDVCLDSPETQSECVYVFGRARLGQAPQPAPNSAWRSSLQQGPSLVVGDPKHDGFPLRAGLARFARGNLCLQIPLLSEAFVGNRTLAAQWSLPFANRCTQVHQCLGVIGQALARQAGFALFPELTLDIALAWPIAQAELAA